MGHSHGGDGGVRRIPTNSTVVDLFLVVTGLFSPQRNYWYIQRNYSIDKFNGTIGLLIYFKAFGALKLKSYIIFIRFLSLSDTYSE